MQSIVKKLSAIAMLALATIFIASCGDNRRTAEKDDEKDDNGTPIVYNHNGLPFYFMNGMSYWGYPMGHSLFNSGFTAPSYSPPTRTAFTSTPSYRQQRSSYVAPKPTNVSSSSLLSKSSAPTTASKPNIVQPKVTSTPIKTGNSSTSPARSSQSFNTTPVKTYTPAPSPVRSYSPPASTYRSSPSFGRR